MSRQDVEQLSGVNTLVDQPYIFAIKVVFTSNIRLISIKFESYC